MHVVFDHAETLSDDISTYHFKSISERVIHYTAGQFVELKVPHTTVDERGDTRWLTLSSAPSEPLLAVTTKHAPSHSSSYKKALRRLKAGDQLECSEPMGDFVLPQIIQRPLIFVAGGIGITPFRSMLRWLADTHQLRPIQLLYAVDNEDSIIFQSVFQAAHQHASIIVKHPSSAWGGIQGTLTADTIIGVEQPTDETLIYLAGPELMVSQLSQDLQKRGIGPHQLVTDYFSGYENI